MFNVYLLQHAMTMVQQTSSWSIRERGRFSCNQCDHISIKASHLKEHVERVHQGVIHPCNQCKYKASRARALKGHLERVHEGVCYPCEQCDYKAVTKSSLKDHIKIEHKGFCYECIYECIYKSRTNTSLNEHIDNVHKGICHIWVTSARKNKIMDLCHLYPDFGLVLRQVPKIFFSYFFIIQTSFIPQVF